MAKRSKKVAWIRFQLERAPIWTFGPLAPCPFCNGLASDLTDRRNYNLSRRYCWPLTQLDVGAENGCQTCTLISKAAHAFRRFWKDGAESEVFVAWRSPRSEDSQHTFLLQVQKGK